MAGVKMFLLFGLLVGSATAVQEDLPLGKVQDLVEVIDRGIRTAGADQISLPDLSNDFFFVWLETRNANLGNFSSLLLTPGEGQVFTKEVGSGGPTTYRYDLRVSLSELLASLQFNYSIYSLLSDQGTLRVSFRENSLHIKGNLTLDSSKECLALLETAEITHLDNVSVDIAPGGLLRSVFSYFLQFGLNQATNRIMAFINESIQSYSHSELFTFIYSNFVCKSIQPLLP